MTVVVLSEGYDAGVVAEGDGEGVCHLDYGRGVRRRDAKESAEDAGLAGGVAGGGIEEAVSEREIFVLLLEVLEKGGGGVLMALLLT